MRHLTLCVGAGLLVAGGAWAGCKPPKVPKTVLDPSIKVMIERIDPARFPLVDVYFRVQDVNGTTKLHELKFKDIQQVVDGAVGQAAVQRVVMPPAGAEGGGNPVLVPAVVRPLATAFSIDRSGSVDPVLENIKEAVSNFVHTELNAEKNTPPNPDVMYAIALSGIPRNLETCLRTGPPAGATNPLGFESDPGTLDAFLNNLIIPERFRLGSPIYRAWDAAEAEVAAHPYEFPEAARCLVSITDGYNNVAPGRECALIKAITGARVPNFVMGFVKIGKTAVAAGSVLRPVLVEAATVSGGAYFEPTPPIPKGLKNPPLKGTDDEKRDYVFNGLALLHELYTNDTDPPPPLTPAILAGGKLLTAKPATGEALVAAFDGDDLPARDDAVTFTDTELKDFHKDVNAGRTLDAKTFSKEDLSEFYNVEVAQFLRKINRSLKHVYVATYRVDEPVPFDLGLREASLKAGYEATRTFPTVTVLPLDGVGKDTFHVPAVIPENQPFTVTAPSPVLGPDAVATLAADNPRGGAWDGPVGVSMVVSLWLEVHADKGQPTQVMKVATQEITPEGPQDIKLVAPPEAAIGLSAGQDGAPGEAELYLRALRPSDASVALAGAGAVVSFKVQPAVPTCSKNPDKLRPPLNETEPKRGRLMWYTVEPFLNRSYTLQIKQLGAKDKPPKPSKATANTVFIPPGTTTDLQKGGTVIAGGPLDGSVQVKRHIPLPAVVLYVSDQTPPSLSAYLTNDESGTCLATQREEPVDAAAAPLYSAKTYVIGKAFVGDPKGTPEAPRAIDDLSTTGYVVTQGVAVRLQIAAKDNFDRHHNNAYLVDNSLPFYNLFTLEQANAQEMKDFQAPYLDRAVEAALFADPPTATGVCWRFEDKNGGHAEDALADSKVFRTPNVRVDESGTVTPDGDPILLHVRAADASGNVSDLKLPILVAPNGIKLDQLKFSAERR